MPEVITDEGILRQLSATVNDLEVGEIVEQLSISIPDTALGLSAPQIGIHKRAFIANLSSGSSAFINPVIVSRNSEKVPSKESCLSLPGTIRCIERSPDIEVSCDKMIGINDGSVVAEPEPMRVKGQDAFIIQHETDHLDGVLIIDYPEIKTSEELCLERENKRKERIAKKRFEKSTKKLPESKPLKMNAKRLAKKKKEELKIKRQTRRTNKREKMRVEIQERFRAEKEGLLEDQFTSAESVENPENTEL